MNQIVAIAESTKSTQLYSSIGGIEPSSKYADFLETIPTSTVNVSDYFRSLADEWKRDTGHLSLISQRINHPAYKRIIRMGRTAIPLILEEMQRSPGHWFHALTMLADSNPVPPDFDGTVDGAAELWITWGRSEKIIND